MGRCSLVASTLTPVHAGGGVRRRQHQSGSSASQLLSVSKYDVIFTNGFQPLLFDGGVVYN